MNILFTMDYSMKVFCDILSCCKEALFVFLLEKYTIVPDGNWVIALHRHT